MGKKEQVPARAICVQGSLYFVQLHERIFGVIYWTSQSVARVRRVLCAVRPLQALLSNPLVEPVNTRVSARVQVHRGAARQALRRVRRVRAACHSRCLRLEPLQPSQTVRARARACKAISDQEAFGKKTSARSAWAAARTTGLPW